MKSMKVDNQMLVSSNMASIFYSEVIKWRQYAAKSWSLIFLFALIYADFTITNFQFKTFIISIFTNLFTFQLWLFSATILVMYWIVLSFYDRLFKVTPFVYSNNIERTLEVFYSPGSLYLLLRFVSTFCISLMLVKLNDYKMCNQSALFVILFTCFNDFILNFQFLFNQTYLLYWPFQQQPKSIRFKSKLNRIVVETCKNTASNFLAWIMIYLFMRINVSFDGEDSQFSIFNLRMLIVSLKMSFMVNLANKISWHLYEIYMTEIYHFPIQPADPSQLSLSMAISLHNHPYIQVLGLLDFVDISINNKQKREKLFSLSFPSNLPLNWNDVSEETASVLKKFIDKFDFDDILHGSGSGYSSTVAGALISPKSPIKRFGSTPSMTTNLRAHAKSNNIQFLDPVIQKLKKSKVFVKFYNENLNYKNQHLFIDSLVTCYAITALRNIIIASYDEDEYGVVQTNLKHILTTFVQLQKILEKFAIPVQMMNLQVGLLQKEDLTQVDLLIQKLIYTLNESLSKIAQTFGNSLKSVDLTEQVQKRLEKYCFNTSSQY